MLLNKSYKKKTSGFKKYFHPIYLCLFLVICLFPSGSFTDNLNIFQLNPVKETYFLASGLSLNLIGDILISNINSTNISNLSSKDLPSFDRCAVDYYSSKIDHYSDYTSYAVTGIALLSALPLLSGINDDNLKMAATDFTILFETELISLGLVQSSKGITKRARPYAYNEELSLEKRSNKEASLSFLSGHTTYAFTTAVAAGNIFQNRYPDSAYKIPVWTFGISCASATAIFRVKSGNHFPSDVLASAAVGSLTGWLIPKIHRSYNNKITISPLFNNTRGFLFSFAF